MMVEGHQAQIVDWRTAGFRHRQWWHLRSRMSPFADRWFVQQPSSNYVVVTR